MLTTHRRDGTPVGTPVHIVVDGDRTFVRTWDTTGKLKRIRNDPSVEVCPSTAGGRPTGPGIRARARVLEGDESAYAGRMLSRKYLACMDSSSRSFTVCGATRPYTSS